MPDRRQILRTLLLGAAGLVTVPASCGLPSGGAPIVDGPGPPLGPGAGDTNRKAPTPADATDAQSLVFGFFGAVAGRLQVDGDVNAAADRAGAFLTSDFRQKWAPGNQITVVRRLARVPPRNGGDKQGTIVDLTVLPVGVLQQNGTVAPPATASTGPVPLRFTVVNNTEAGRSGPYLIDNIEYGGASGGLSGMMLDAANLDFALYAPQLIYFWSTDKQRPGLVPDLRYVPRVGVSPEIQLTEIVKWVLDGLGPTDLLTTAVLGNQYTGNDLVVPLLTAPDSGGLLINLTIPPPKSLGNEQAMAQLRWSLRPFYTGTVRLQVNSAPQQVNGSSTDFRHRNLAEGPFFDGDQTEYCVANGVVRPVLDPGNPPAVLSDLTTVNKDVRYAALSRDRAYAALVKTDLRLYLVGGPGSGRAVTSIPLTGTQWTRPAFLPANSPRVLVAVDGWLYLVTPAGEVTRLDGMGRLVTAFSVAPDGHRIGLISGGLAYVYGVKVNGDDIAFGTARQIDAGLSDCTGIAWSRLDRVLVAGESGANPPQYTVAEVTIDGAIANAWQPAFAARILSVVAQPPQPWDATGAGAAMVHTANGVAWEAYPNHNAPLAFPPTSQPSPSAAAAGAVADFGVPTYPFYID